MSGYCPSVGSLGSLTLSSPVYINHNHTPYNDDIDETMYNDEQKPIYSRIQIIGEGAYGTVYLAENLSTSKLCVIKQMKRSSDDDDGIQPTELREASLLKNLKHKHIVEILDIFVTQYKELCLVFEHCQMDLTQFMDHNKRNGIKLELIRKWSYQMLSGLAYIHSRRILHRDLKPQNILITHDMNIKIGDLGLGKEHNIPIKSPITTNVVTLWYRPPELLFGAQCYGTKLDIWSAGCIIAEMGRRGKVLFGGLCEWEVIMTILQFFGTPSVKEEWCRDLPYFYKSMPKFKGMKFENAMGIPLRNDEYAIDLLKKMLNMDSTKRVNAIKLIKHEWFDEVKDKECDVCMKKSKDEINKVCMENNRKWERYFDEIKEVQSPKTPAPHKEYTYDNEGFIKPEILRFQSGNDDVEPVCDRCNDNTLNKGFVLSKTPLKDIIEQHDTAFTIKKNNLNKTNDTENQRNRNEPKCCIERKIIDSSPVF